MNSYLLFNDRYLNSPPVALNKTARINDNTTCVPVNRPHPQGHPNPNLNKSTRAPLILPYLSANKPAWDPTTSRYDTLPRANLHRFYETDTHCPRTVEGKTRMNHFNDGGAIGCCACGGVRLHLASHACRGNGSPEPQDVCAGRVWRMDCRAALQTGFESIADRVCAFIADRV